MFKTAHCHTSSLHNVFHDTHGAGMASAKSACQSLNVHARFRDSTLLNTVLMSSCIMQINHSCSLRHLPLALPHHGTRFGR